MNSKIQAIEALIGQLENGDEVDRCYAAQALGQLQDPTALEPLYRHLQDEDLDVCIDAAAALGQIGSDDAVQGLIDALHYHSEVDVKQAAIEGLSKCGGELAKQTLQQVLDRPDDIQMSETEGWDDWWDLQLQAVKALGDNAVADAAEALAEMLDSDDGQDIESEILKALVQTGPAGIDQLIQRLDGSAPRRQRRIAVALQYGDTEAAHELLFTLFNSDDADVREAATQALAANGMIATTLGSQQLAALSVLLRDPAAQVQTAALKGLQRLRSLSDVSISEDKLLELLENSDSRVRSAALYMLTQNQELPDQQSALLFHLQQGLGSDDEEEQQLCCELLGRIDPAVAQDQLLALIGDIATPMPVRRQAIRAIGQSAVADASMLEMLWNSSSDSNAAIRHVALQSLQVLNNRSLQSPTLTPVSADTDADTSADTSADTATSADAAEGAPTPFSLLLSSLTGSEVIWPSAVEEGDKDSDSDIVADQTDDQLISLVSVDGEGHEIKPGLPPMVAKPGIEQILASVSDAYPAPYPETDVDSGATVEMGSTLESITRSNIEATVGVSQELSSDSERILGLVDELPQEFDAYAEVVHTNARSGERMLEGKRRKPDEIAVERRILAARVLGDCAQAEAVQPLLGCLMDEDANLRREAAESLGRLVSLQPKLPGLSNIMGPIATQLRAGNEEIRLACARTLGALKHKAAIPALLAALDDPDTLVRIQAIRSLTLVTLGKGRMLTEEDHVVLNDVTPNRVTQAILDCQDDAEIGVRKEVIESLVQLRRLDLELLLKLGLEQGGALTPTAAQALKRLDPDAATERLIESLAEQGDSSVRRLAMQMLQHIHRAEAA
ncbi:MAG: HEAT repeat domain-containing protein [Motiliproteus sp.]